MLPNIFGKHLLRYLYNIYFICRTIVFTSVLTTTVFIITSRQFQFSLVSVSKELRYTEEKTGDWY